MLLATTRCPVAVVYLFCESERKIVDSYTHRPDVLFSIPQWQEEAFMQEVSNLSAITFTKGNTVQIPGVIITNYFMEKMR